MSDVFGSDRFHDEAGENHAYDEMDGEDLASEEVAEAFFGYNEDQAGFRWFGNLVGLGVLVAYLLRLSELVLNTDQTFPGLDIDPDPSIFRMLAAAGDVFYTIQAGLIVLVGAALVVRFRPANDGVRATLRLTAIVVMVGSIASVLGSLVSGSRVSVFDVGNWKVAALQGAGVAALQAATALVTLNSEREANRVPSVAIVGLLVSAVMGFGTVFVDVGFVETSASGLDDILSGVGNVRQLALLGAAVLVSVTGWAKLLRTAVLVVSAVVITLALALFVTSLQEDVSDSAYYGSTAGYVTPSLVLAALTAFGLASMPFVRTAPDA